MHSIKSTRAVLRVVRGLSGAVVRRPACVVTALSVGLFAMTACDRSVTAPTPSSSATVNVIAQVVSNVYLPTFDSIAARGADLSASLQALATSPNATTLANAQAAWRLARVQYERNEGFAFGPLITQEIDPSIDSWPIDRTGIDALLAGAGALSLADIDALDGSLKGFHGIEYVIFGVGGTKQASALTTRERQYIASAGQSLANQTAQLKTAWVASGGNYSGALTTAGSASSVYGSPATALQEIVNGLVEPTDEVANSKLGLPLQANSTDYEESAFSNNTLADLQNDLTGSYAVYLGGYGTAAPVSGGVSSLVVAQNPQLDALVRAQYSQAFTALAAVQPSFDAALHNNPALLRTAQQAVLTLNHTLAQRVIPLVGGLEDAD